MQTVLHLRKIRDFGENLSDTIQFLKFNWKKLAILYAVFVVPLLLVATLIGSSSFAALFTSLTRGGIGSFPDAADVFNFPFFIAIVLFFLSSASYGTVVYLYMRLYEENNGIQPTISDVGKLFLPKLLSNFGMTILVSLLMAISALIAIIPILGWIILLFGFIYLAITFSLLYPINTIESNDIFTSIRRSFFLIRNRWWYTFGYLIILVLIYYFFSVIISLVVNLIFGFSSVNFIEQPNSDFFTQKYFLITGISAIFQQIFYLIIYVGLGMYYFSLREEKKVQAWRKDLSSLAAGAEFMARSKNNTKRMRSFFYAIICWLILESGFSVTKPLAAQSLLQKDSSSVSVKSLDKNRIDAYRSQKEFMYSTHTGRQMSGWDIFWSWFWDHYYRLMNRKGFRTGIEILIWTLGIGITAYAIIRLVGTEKIMLWIKGEKFGPDAFTISEDDIHGIDFAQSISAAEVKGDFREAIRLQYLRSLKYLSDHTLILWSPSKTNIDYASELRTSGFADGFQQLTRYYEYAWYGEFMPGSADYRKISAIFQHFNEGVQR